MGRKRSVPGAHDADVGPVVPIGAAFGVPIDGDLFGLCRVIARARARDGAKIFATGPAARSAVLVLATRWTGTRRQLASALADARARQPLRLTHHTWRDKPYVVLVQDLPPASFVPVGHLPPTSAEAKLRKAYYVWATLVHQYQAQLAWEADADAVRARDAENARRLYKTADRGRAGARARPARAVPSGTRWTLAALARRSPFADWREPLRARARERIAKLIVTLRSRGRAAKADLRAITSCARAFNREREIGTLEAEALDGVLLAIAGAVGVDPDTYRRAIDDARDW